MPKVGFTYRDKQTEKFCGLVVLNPKLEGNIATLFRSAAALDSVDFLATIGERYERLRGDTVCSTRRIPCFHFPEFRSFFDSMPQHCELVGVEMSNDSVDLKTFQHPDRAVYMFGSEDTGIPDHILNMCRMKVALPSPLGISMNLSSSGSMVLWDRYLKTND